MKVQVSERDDTATVHRHAVKAGRSTALHNTVYVAEYQHVTYGHKLMRLKTIAAKAILILQTLNSLAFTAADLRIRRWQVIFALMAMTVIAPFLQQILSINLILLPVFRMSFGIIFLAYVLSDFVLKTAVKQVRGGSLY